MKNRLAPVKNVAALQAAYEALECRDPGVPGMGLVHGQTGAGKTTAVTWLMNRTNAIYVRAAATWTPAAMLGKIMNELGAEQLARGSAAMVDFITTTMAQDNRPLFVDEADYLVSNLKMLETLRDIHDVSGMPVLLVGMANIEKRLAGRKQLLGRISQWVEFAGCDAEDAATLARTVCEVGIAPDLLSRVHAEAHGSMRLLVVGLSRIESLAKAQGWSQVTAEQWGGRKLFLTGNGHSPTHKGA